MSALFMLKKAYLQELKDAVVRNGETEAYESAEEFSLDENGLRRTHLELGEAPPLIINEDLPPHETDYDNAVLLHPYLNDLTLAQATLKPFWVYLTHGPYFRYCQWRWLSGRKDKVASTIRWRWFTGREGARGLLRNAISSLW
jgi:hypothetical protein